MQRSEVLQEDGVTWYRSSSYGGCQRALVAARLHYEPIERTKPFEPYERGHEAEEMTVARLREDHWQVTNRQDEVVLRLDDSHGIICHIDGLIHNDHLSEHLLEIKSHRDAGISDMLMERYRWQISPAMIQLGLPCVIAKWNVDQSSYHMTFVANPPHTLDEIREHVALVESYETPGDAPCNGNFPCPYFPLHDIPDLVHDPALTDAACDYLAAKARVDLAQADLKVARAELESLVRTEGKVTLDSGIVVNKYSTVRATYNMKAMEQDGIDIGPYRKTTRSGALRVYTVDEDDAGQS